MLKGYTKGFTAESPVVVIDEAGSGKEHRIAVADLKVAFFIKSFEGSKAQGFFLIPVDRDSNNVKVFVFGTLVKDVTIMMKVKYSDVKSGAEAG